MCTVRLRYKDKNAKCRFFVVPGDGPALLGMPDIELLHILKIMCDMIGDPHNNRKLDLQTAEASNCPDCRTNSAIEQDG